MKYVFSNRVQELPRKATCSQTNRKFRKDNNIRIILYIPPIRLVLHFVFIILLWSTFCSPFAVPAMKLIYRFVIFWQMLVYCLFCLFVSCGFVVVCLFLLLSRFLFVCFFVFFCCLFSFLQSHLFPKQIVSPKTTATTTTKNATFGNMHPLITMSFHFLIYTSFSRVPSCGFTDSCFL